MNRKKSYLLIGALIATFTATASFAANEESINACVTALQASPLPQESATLKACYLEAVCGNPALASIPHCGKKLSHWYWNSLTPAIPTIPPDQSFSSEPANDKATPAPSAPAESTKAPITPQPPTTPTTPAPAPQKPSQEIHW